MQSLKFGWSEDGLRNITFNGKEVWKAWDWETEEEAENHAHDELDFIYEIGIDKYFDLITV